MLEIKICWTNQYSPDLTAFPVFSEIAVAQASQKSDCLVVGHFFSSVYKATYCIRATISSLDQSAAFLAVS